MEETKALVTQGSAVMVDMQQYANMAQVFIKSGYFDSALGRCSPEVMVARAQVKLAAGAEIDLPPFLALQGIHWIQPEGQAGRLMKGAAVCAYVLGRSKKYRYTTIERSEKQAVIEFEEYREGAWVKVYTSTFTQQMAGAMVNKAVYKNYMPAMLWNRAMTNGSNTVGSDELNGPAGEPDEVEGGFTETALIPEGKWVAGKSETVVVAVELAPEPSDAKPEPRRRGPGRHNKGDAEAAPDAEQADSPIPTTEQAASDEIEGAFTETEFDEEASAEADMADQPATQEQIDEVRTWSLNEKFDANAVVKARGLGPQPGAVPTHVVGNLSTFTQDPAVVSAERERVANLILRLQP